MKFIIGLVLFFSASTASLAYAAAGNIDCQFKVLIEYRFKSFADPEDPKRFVMMLKESTIKADWDLHFTLDRVEWPELRVQSGVHNTVEDQSVAMILRPDVKTGDRQLLVIVDPFGSRDMRYLTPIYDWNPETLVLQNLTILDYEIADVAGWFTTDFVASISLGQITTILKEMFGEEKYLAAKWRASYSPEAYGQYNCKQELDEVVCRLESWFNPQVYSSLVDEEYFNSAKKPNPNPAPWLN